MSITAAHRAREASFYAERLVPQREAAWERKREQADAAFLNADTSVKAQKAAVAVSFRFRGVLQAAQDWAALLASSEPDEVILAAAVSGIARLVEADVPAPFLKGYIEAMTLSTADFIEPILQEADD